MTRIVRSKLRIDVLCQAILGVLNDYPELSTNAVASFVGWTQSSFQRALESRDMANLIEGRSGRKSVQEVVGELGLLRYFDTITKLLDELEAVKAIDTQAEETLPGYEAPAPKAPKATKAAKAAEATDEADTEVDEVESEADEETESPDEFF